MYIFKCLMGYFAVRFNYVIFLSLRFIKFWSQWAGVSGLSSGDMQSLINFIIL